MKLLSTNVGEVREVIHDSKTVKTAIWKTPVEGSVEITRLGLVGDVQANKKHHGGPEQPIYVYDHSNYEFWSAELGRDDFTFGQFGENFTVAGMPEDQVCIGDTFRVGSATLQVSQPRTPCFKLDLRMNTPGFLKPFTQACRIGYYLRVLEEGEVSADQTIERIDRETEPMTVSEVFRAMHIDNKDLDAAKRAATLPGLSPEWREKFAKRSETTI